MLNKVTAAATAATVAAFVLAMSIFTKELPTASDLIDIDRNVEIKAQKNDDDCAAAVVQSIALFYGYSFSQEELAQRMEKDSHGVAPTDARDFLMQSVDARYTSKKYLTFSFGSTTEEVAEFAKHIISNLSRNIIPVIVVGDQIPQPKLEGQCRQHYIFVDRIRGYLSDPKSLFYMYGDPGSGSKKMFTYSDLPRMFRHGGFLIGSPLEK